MSIASEITRINNNISSAYAAVVSLGGDLPESTDSDHLSAAIGTISSGTPQTDCGFCQINPAAEAYLDEVSYDPSDNYANSSIGDSSGNSDYVDNSKSNGTVSPSNTDHRPTGCTLNSPVAGTLSAVDGKVSVEQQVVQGENTVYNLTPLKPSPYVIKDGNGTIRQYGLISPTGSLRMIKLNDAGNVRDLGGWACDGGTVKYGKLFRGTRLFINYDDEHRQDIDAYDLNTLHDVLGIRHELELRGANDPKRSYSLIGSDVAWTHVVGIMYNNNSEVTNLDSRFKDMLNCVFDCAIKGVPLYFHCAGGADRTGTLAMMLESVLGVSPGDIDKDYELTSFFSGVATDQQARRRNESDWIGLISAFDTYAYTGSTLRDRVVKWMIRLGITVDRINAFRHAMINGAPADLTNPWGTAAVTRTLSHITTDNIADSVPMYESYSATLTADSGYSLSGASVTVTMGGVDITSSCYTNGVISVPQVSGALVITATAASMYTNQILHAKAAIGGTALYNDTGYKQDYRWNSSNAEDNGAVTGVPNKFAVGYIKLEPGDAVHFYGDILTGTSGGLTMHVQSASDTRLVRATMSNWSDYTNRSDIMAYMTDIDYDSVTKTLRSFKWTGGTNSVVGYMHLSCVGTFTDGVTVVTVNEEM